MSVTEIISIQQWPCFIAPKQPLITEILNSARPTGITVMSHMLLINTYITITCVFIAYIIIINYVCLET